MKTATQKTPTKRELTLSKFVDLIKTNNGTQEDFLNHIIFLYTNNNKPVLAIFGPRGHRPETHFNFKNEAQRANYLADQKTSIQRRHDQDEARMKQYTEEKKGFEVGKILRSSWGCEQTNIDYYLIIERKNDFVTLQEIGENRQTDPRYGDRGTTTPDTNKKVGEPFKKKVSKFASIELASYKFGRLWDEKPDYWSSYA